MITNFMHMKPIECSWPGVAVAIGSKTERDMPLTTIRMVANILIKSR